MTDLKRIEKYLLANLEHEAKIYFIEFLNNKKNVIKLEYYYNYFLNPQTRNKKKQKYDCFIARDYVRIFIYLYNPYWNLAGMWHLDYNDPHLLGKALFIYNEMDKSGLSQYPSVLGLNFVANFIKESRKIIKNN